MEILRYSDLDAQGLEKHVERAAALLREGDFRGADARKMVGSPFYRARLNDKDRLLFRFVVHGGKSHLVLLEVIRNHALLPLLLRVTIDPDLARFHLRNERWLDLPRILATVTQQDLAPIINLAAWPQLPSASRGLLLRTLALLFFWRRASRESVIQVLRQTFEAGIPASDLDQWDVVLSVCCTVAPKARRSKARGERAREAGSGTPGQEM
jgi:hypothetical protein